MTHIQCVLFDLDGTLLDTAPDLTAALNQLRLQHQLPAVPLDHIRPHVGYGVRAILKAGMNVDEQHPAYTRLSEEYLSLYQTLLTSTTQLFPDMEQVLQYLESRQIPWGIVTNKPTRFTFEILKNLGLEHRAACIICGDTLTTRKPDPAPILHALELIQQAPATCLYVGDTLTDVTASKAAGTLSLVTLYGYIGPEENPMDWKADAYVSSAREIIHWLSDRVN